MSLLDVIIGPILHIIDKVIPDPAAKAAAQLEVIKLQASEAGAELEAQVRLATAQTDVNKIEAGSSDPFTSRWRPFIGWICGSGLAVQFLVAPIFTWIATLINHPAVFPALDMGTLMTLLLGMLGLGGMRTVEKIKGAA